MTSLRAETLPTEAHEIRTLMRARKLDDAAVKAEAWTKASPGNAVAWFWSGRVYGAQAISASLWPRVGGGRLKPARVTGTRGEWDGSGVVASAA